MGKVAVPPAVDPVSLRAHDAVVRRMAATVDAVLPARFGTLVADEEELDRLLAFRATELTEAIELVAGREQMTLRVFRVGRTAGKAAPARVRARAGTGAGTAYLAARMAADRRARSAPEIAWLRPVLRDLVAAERIERHRAGSLVASVYHLIARGQSSAYLAAVEEASRRRRAVRVVPSGPWPPYAFAPTAVGA